MTSTQQHDGWAARFTRNGVAAGTAITMAFGTVATSSQQLAAQSIDTGATQPAACTAPAPGVLTMTAGSISGQAIRGVAVVTQAPHTLPGAAAIIDNLHIRTRESTVRRRLLFAPGDTVDSLRVAESLRRLRALRYLTDVELLVARCAGPDSGVALTVATRDAWTTKPTMRIRGNGAKLGLEERNLLGTGRSGAVYLRSDAGRIGVGLAYSDPWLFGSNISGSLARDSYRDGTRWNGVLQTRERSIFDPLRVELAAGWSTRATAPTAALLTGDSVYRAAAHVLVHRRVAASPAGVTAVLAGAEYSRTMVSAGTATPIIGPASVRRAFAGLDLGLARRSAQYATRSWLLGGGPAAKLPVAAVAELPIGFEGEALLGVGRDFATGRPALHADMWAGRIWSPGASLLLSTDAWASGFRSGPEWSAGSARATINVIRPAPRGLWSVRLAAETLVDPDPDVRALITGEPVLRALAARGSLSGSGLAESALAASLERSVRLRGIGRTYALDAALFGAGAMRWDLPTRSALQSGLGATGGNGGGDRLYIGVLGAGLRLAPTRFGRATLRLDVGVPVIRSSALASRPFVAVSITPSFGSDRRRDGSGTP